ncbi:MAG: hypothetical protein HEQ25_05485 [Dolichospermum sp. DET73]|nr:hypothetical protein [Dolichospermum sp. DET73]
MSVRARSQESGVRSQEEELEEEKNSIESIRHIFALGDLVFSIIKLLN